MDRSAPYAGSGGGRVDRRRRADERGDTLIEILAALLIISIVIIGYFSNASTAITGSKTHRDLVTADAVLRDDAETIKTAVRTQCVNGASSYTASYAAPAGFSVNQLGAHTCPPPTAPAQLTLTVSLPEGLPKTLQIVVRTP